MTFEEIKDMINSTITENGQRHITGKALNLALLEILTAIEEFLANNKPEGAGIETIYFFDDPENMTLTPEHQATNAEVYAKCAAAVAEGKPLPGLQIDVTSMVSFTLTTDDYIVEFSSVSNTIDIAIFAPEDKPVVPIPSIPDGLVGLYVSTYLGIFNDTISMQISEDGSIMLIQ